MTTATNSSLVSSKAFWTLALAAALSACSAETVDDDANAQADASHPQKQALTNALRENETFLSLSADLQHLGYDVKLADAAYEADEGSHSNPETGETVSNVETLIIPVVDSTGREMAWLRQSSASSDDAGAAFALAASDIDSSRLNRVLGELAALNEEGEAPPLAQNPERRVMATSPGCYPWTCYFTSRRIWTISCLTKVAGGWAKVPASVSGYRVCCSTLPCP